MSIVDIVKGAKVAIYRITSPSNKIYIGQSRNIESRFNSYNSINCKNQKYLRNSLVKYGVNKHLFEIVQELPNDINQTTLDTMELEILNRFRDCGFAVLNIKLPGYRGKILPENKYLLKENRKKYPPKTEECRRKHAQAMRTRWLTTGDVTFAKNKICKKYSEDLLKLIAKDIKCKLSQKEISNKYNISIPSIRSLLVNRLPDLIRRRK